MELDDDDDDDEDDMLQNQQHDMQSRQLSDSFNPMLQLFNTLSNVLVQSAAGAAQKSGAELIGLDRNEELKGDDGGDNGDDNVTENGN